MVDAGAAADGACDDDRMSTMSRHTVSSSTPWEPIVGYSRAVRIGDTIAVSGTTAAPVAGARPGDLADQTREALTRVVAALRELGAGPEDVIRTRMYVLDISAWEVIGRIHGEFFGDIRPAASMVQVSALIEPGLLIEIEADAIVALPSRPDR